MQYYLNLSYEDLPEKEDRLIVRTDLRNVDRMMFNSVVTLALCKIRSM